MGDVVLLIGGIYGLLGVILGAFGAHVLKKRLDTERLQSFETGVKFQMNHALMLILIGLWFPFTSRLSLWMAWSFILGVCFFSFSIYGLVWSVIKGKKLVFLGPITPLGGSLLLLGWILFIWIIIRDHF